MKGLLEGTPPAVQVLAAFALALVLESIATHRFGLDRGPANFAAGMMVGIAIGAVLNRPRRRRALA